MRRLLIAALAVATLVGCGYSPGINSTADTNRSALAAEALGAKVARVAFDIGASPASMSTAMEAFADRDIQVLLLASFHARTPTVAEAQNMAGWANTYGPGSAFCASRPDVCVTSIEFGNETSYCYQYPVNCGGAWWNEASYAARAELYADRVVQARQAIDFTGKAVGLLVQADDGGSGSAQWVDHMFDSEPALASKVAGWVVHPYGPRVRWEAKIDRLIAQTAANGASASIPIDVTEYGPSSDNGAVVYPDNYGWATNLTYAQAATELDAGIDGMRAEYGDRLQHFIIYSAYDLAATGVKRCVSNTVACREDFFGAVKLDLTDKGTYSTEVREQLAAP